MKVIILILGCLSLVGCGGGDGANQGGSVSNSGSAVFQNFSASSVVPNICRNFVVPTDSFACTSAGGTWSSRACKAFFSSDFFELSLV